jgi:phosphoribosyl 1,2-cyclic phosphate phosphodiesterase
VGIGKVDAVLYTHDHADHVAGIDDLRALSVRQGQIPVYGPAETLNALATRFGYIFDDGVVPPPGSSKPDLQPAPLEPYVTVRIAGMEVIPLEADHGGCRVFGYRIGPAAYLTDAKHVPTETVERLRGVAVLVVNALFDWTHPTHLSIPEAVGIARAVGADRTVLTHLTHRYRHADLAARLPAGVEPASDGLVIEF